MDDASLLASLPDDVDQLKRLLVGQYAQRQERDRIITQREQTISKLTEQRDAYYLEKLRLEMRLAKALKQAYGPRADRVTDLGQLLLAFESQLAADPAVTEVAEDQAAEPDESATPRPSPPPADRRLRTRGRRDIGALKHLPLIEQIYELDDELCRCPRCQVERKTIGAAISYTVEFIPGSFVRIKHVQRKYACQHCEQDGHNPNISLAAKTNGSPIVKGMPGPGLLAYVATAKFADYLPLHRLQNIFAREGFELDRSTMSVWLADVARLVRPVYDWMVQRVLQAHVLATDDTPMPMQHPGKTKKARMWIYRGDEAQPYNVFDFTESRKRDGPAAFLQNFRGTLLADAYGGYDGIVLEQDLPRAGCWAHARRKFVDCQAAAPQAAHAILRLIKRLFELERRIKHLDAAQRLHWRSTEAVRLLTALRALLDEQKDQLLPKHPLAEAIRYTLNQWRELTLFTTDPAVPIDNNLAEQQMKRIALLRKNALFVATPNGGRTAAILSSLTSTCRRHEVNPQVYLTQLLANVADVPPAEIDHWLPDVWQQQAAKHST